MLDALVSLFCRSNISAEILWDGGWLLRQLLPYSEAEFNSHHLKLLKVSYTWKSTENIFLDESSVSYRKKKKREREKALSFSVFDCLKEICHAYYLHQ